MTFLRIVIPLYLLFEHDLFGKPVPTFPDHALTCPRIPQSKGLHGRVQPHRRRRDFAPLRRLAHCRGLLSGGDLRLGPRLLRPERLRRRAASPARLAGIADLERHNVLLPVRRVAGRLRQRSDPRLRPPQLPAGGPICAGRGGRLDRSGHRAVAALPGQCRAGFRLGWYQPWDHHQYARPLVRQETRHGDQPRAERCKFWRHHRRAAVGGGNRSVRILRRHDHGGGRDGRDDGSDRSDFRRAAAHRRFGIRLS
jgi:hypothetical protein